jgi:hypothetical protein
MRIIVLIGVAAILASCASPNMTANPGQQQASGASTEREAPAPPQLRLPPRQSQGWGGNAYGAPGGNTYWGPH